MRTDNYRGKGKQRRPRGSEEALQPEIKPIRQARMQVHDVPKVW